MTADLIVFGAVGIIAVLAGIGVVVAGNAVHSALFLAVNFLCLAVLYVTLNAEFLAAVQAVIYAGAVLVLFLFAVTLLPMAPSSTGKGFLWRTAFALGLTVSLLVEIVAALILFTGSATPGSPSAASGAASSVTSSVDGSPEAIGQTLFTDFLFPFEIASVLLLVAIVGAMVLSRRRL